MKRLLALSVLLLAACASAPGGFELPEGCSYPGASVQCRGLNTG